jgi:hypothetical protein
MYIVLCLCVCMLWHNGERPAPVEAMQEIEHDYTQRLYSTSGLVERLLMKSTQLSINRRGI